ncbi:MAG: PA2778 family cysteine peptidase [Candidatus Thiodiazotropha sp.]
MLFTGCASQAPLLPPLVDSQGVTTQLELTDTPFHPQKQYQCGPAALATLLEQSGVSVSVESLVPLVYLPEKKGSLQIEMLAASRRLGRIPYVIDPSLASLLAELQAKRPVLVLQNLGIRIWPVWHYAVVIGYSAEADEVILRSGINRRETLSVHRFLGTWEAGSNWAMIVLEPGELPARPEPLPYLKAVAAMEQLLPAKALIAAYQAALNQWPESPIARFGIAASQHSEGALRAAELGYRKLLAIHPDYIPAYNNLAEVLADRGCFDEALETLHRALQKMPGELSQHLHATRREIEERAINNPSQISACQGDTNN